MMKIAIIGATGAVGTEMLKDLAESRLRDIEVVAMASERSVGKSLVFRGQSLKVQAFSLEALKGCHTALMSAGSGFSRQVAKSIAELGVFVVDNSSAWRMESGVPLVVPEVNGQILSDRMSPCIIANPNCSTIQLVVALEPLRKAFGLEQVQVASYQSVSGTGQKGIDELKRQVQDLSAGRAALPKVYAHPIAHNLIPAIDKLDSDGHCFEEIKIVKETRKILGVRDLAVFATTVRVPTLHCHGEAVVVRLGRQVTRDRVIAALTNFSGLTVDAESQYETLPTPLGVSGEKGVFVSRVRLPLECKESDWVQLWVIADNLKKGAATNAVQILEKLCLG